MTTNNEPPPVVLVTNAVPKPRAKGQALWTLFFAAQASTLRALSALGKENVGTGTVSQTVSEKSSGVVKNSGELKRITIEFTGVFAILLKLNRAFRSQRAIPTNASRSFPQINMLDKLLGPAQPRIYETG